MFRTTKLLMLWWVGVTAVGSLHDGRGAPLPYGVDCSAFVNVGLRRASAAKHRTRRAGCPHPAADSHRKNNNPKNPKYTRRECS